MPPAALEDCHSCLKPGGYFITAVRTYLWAQGEKHGYRDKLDEMFAQGKLKLIGTKDFKRGHKDGIEMFSEMDSILVIMQRTDGGVSASRQEAIDAAFFKLDLAGSGFIHSIDIRACYNTNMHPLVVSGDITADEAILKFLVNFSDSNNDGTISKSEWDSYYASVSAKIENEGHFVDLMRQVWKN